MGDSSYVDCTLVYSASRQLKTNATHLSMRTSLDGSMDARRDAGPEGRRDERRRSEALRAAGVDMALI